jgi:hypothetical protein
MMELRNRGINEVKEDKISSKTAKKDAKFRKLQVNVIMREKNSR